MDGGDRISPHKTVNYAVGRMSNSYVVGEGQSGTACGAGCPADRVAVRGEFHRDGLPPLGSATA